ILANFVVRNASYRAQYMFFEDSLKSEHLVRKNHLDDHLVWNTVFHFSSSMLHQITSSSLYINQFIGLVVLKTFEDRFDHLFHTDKILLIHLWALHQNKHFQFMLLDQRFLD
ncbi:hypothetical protein KA405_05850, partial [Patescibacteria group bacterium]|nr:hypothetical protein [Patescibacteria group bacterium]